MFSLHVSDLLQLHMKIHMKHMKSRIQVRSVQNQKEDLFGLKIRPRSNCRSQVWGMLSSENNDTAMITGNLVAAKHLEALSNARGKNNSHVVHLCGRHNKL